MEMRPWERAKKTVVFYFHVCSVPSPRDGESISLDTRFLKLLRSSTVHPLRFTRKKLTIKIAFLFFSSGDRNLKLPMYL